MLDDFDNHGPDRHVDQDVPNQDSGTRQGTETGIHDFSMDNHGHIRTDSSGTAAAAANPRVYIVLGWICAALSAFVWPYFAIVGIILGVFANRQARGSGNTVIAANVVLAVIHFLLVLIFGTFSLLLLRRVFFGY